MCMDMCIDVCIEACLDMCLDMCIDVCIDMCLDMCIDVCLGTCIDVCIGTSGTLARLCVSGPAICLYTCLCTCLHNPGYNRIRGHGNIHGSRVVGLFLLRIGAFTLEAVTPFGRYNAESRVWTSFLGSSWGSEQTKERAAAYHHHPSPLDQRPIARFDQKRSKG